MATWEGLLPEELRKEKNKINGNWRETYGI